MPDNRSESDEQTREPQYQRCLELRDQYGLTRLGLMSNQTWHDDPKRLLFVLSRYKFVARMLSGSRHVLEIGAADAFGTRIVRQEVRQLTASDFDPVFAEDAQNRMNDQWSFDYVVHDMLAGPLNGGFDGAYALDVLEHIPPESEDVFISNICGSLAQHGVLILGSPSLESQRYASEWSRAGHVNCKTGPQLKELLAKYFHQVFLFSMNDEIVHTGFYPMAHYRFALCCSMKSSD